jgi:hypothetical protein
MDFSFIDTCFVAYNFILLLFFSKQKLLSKKGLYITFDGGPSLNSSSIPFSSTTPSIK